jgi:hypothetical protein
MCSGSVIDEHPDIHSTATIGAILRILLTMIVIQQMSIT